MPWVEPRVFEPQMFRKNNMEPYDTILLGVWVKNSSIVWVETQHGSMWSMASFKHDSSFLGLLSMSWLYLYSLAMHFRLFVIEKPTMS